MDRRTLLTMAAAVSAGAAAPRVARAATAKTFVLVHGAWHGAWCWERVVPLLARHGHRVVTPELGAPAVPGGRGGSGERAGPGGEIPSAMRAPGGCVFHTRCPRKLGPVCEELEPPLHPGAEPGHEIRCHIPVADLHGNTHCVSGADAARGGPSA